jgi:hypothetical protein
MSLSVWVQIIFFGQISPFVNSFLPSDSNKKHRPDQLQPRNRIIWERAGQQPRRTQLHRLQKNSISNHTAVNLVQMAGEQPLNVFASKFTNWEMRSLAF